MDTATFFENFATIAEAPGGIDRLRDLILDLALHGRLVPNHAARWRTCDLGSVVDLVSGQHLKPDVYNLEHRGIPYLTGPADFKPSGPVESRWTQERRAVAVRGDILLTVKGAGIGKTARLGLPEAAISRQLMAVRALDVDGDYLELLLRGMTARLRDRQVGIAIPGISRGDVLSQTIALPDRSEQRRIVEKVDELMALCDDLEARQQARNQVTTRLRASALDALTTADSDDDLATSWQRVHDNWEALTVDPDGIEELRYAIHDLAIRGRLTQEVAYLKVSEDTRTTPCIGPFGLPADWRWTRLDELCGDDGVSDGPFGSKLKKSHYVDDRGYRVIRLGNIGRGAFKDEDKAYISQDHFNDLRRYHLQPGDLLVASLGSPPGRTCLVPSGVGSALNKADCFRVRVGGDVLPSYLVVYLNSPSTIARAISLHRGDTRGRITLTHLRSTPVALPPIAEQSRIVELVARLTEMCDSIDAALDFRNLTAEALAESVGAALPTTA